MIIFIKIWGYCSCMNSFRHSFVGGCSGTVRHVRCCFSTHLEALDFFFPLTLVLEIFSALALNVFSVTGHSHCWTEVKIQVQHNTSHLLNTQSKCYSIWDLFTPLTDLEALCCRFELDVRIFHEIKTTQYLHGQTPVLKLGNIDIAWEYALNTRDHACFVDMLHISPQVFDVILYFIHDHPVFHNNSNNPQAPIQTQLPVTMYWMGWYGNSASVKDIARIAGISEGSVDTLKVDAFEKCSVHIWALHLRNATAVVQEPHFVLHLWQCVTSCDYILTFCSCCQCAHTGVSASISLAAMGKWKDKDGPTAPKKTCKVSNIPPLPWTAERFKLV